MALQTTFNRLKREVGIKRCVILDGNVGDVYLNDKKQIVDLKQYLTDMLKGMEYDDVLYWDRIDGIDGDVSRLSVIDEVEVEGDAYSFDDDEENQPQAEEKTGSGQFKEPAEIFNIVFKNLKKPNRKTAFVLNWADYLFSSGGQLPPDERELITMLGKAIKDKKTEYLSAEVNESTVILITGKLAMFPISFYQGNPEVACLTLSKPDREERAKMMEKIESGFDVKLKPGETLLTSDKFNEYVDMLDDFTNREIVQMARLSRKEGKMPFEQLYLLFKYGEKDNPWEKLDYKSVKNIKKILSERVVGQEEAIEKIEKVVVKAYMGLTGIHKSSSRSAPKGVLFFGEIGVETSRLHIESNLSGFIVTGYTGNREISAVGLNGRGNARIAYKITVEKKRNVKSLARGSVRGSLADKNGSVALECEINAVGALRIAARLRELELVHGKNVFVRGIIHAVLGLGIENLNRNYAPVGNEALENGGTRGRIRLNAFHADCLTVENGYFNIFSGK